MVGGPESSEREHTTFYEARTYNILRSENEARKLREVNLVALVDWRFIKLHKRQPGERDIPVPTLKLDQRGSESRCGWAGHLTRTELIRNDIRKSDRRHTEPPEELNSPSEQLAPSAMNRANTST